MSANVSLTIDTVQGKPVRYFDSPSQRCSSSHKKTASGLKFSDAEALCERISQLIGGGNGDDSDIQREDLGAEPVIWDADVFGARGKLTSLCKLEARSDTFMNERRGNRRWCWPRDFFKSVRVSSVVNHGVTMEDNGHYFFQGFSNWD